MRLHKAIEGPSPHSTHGHDLVLWRRGAEELEQLVIEEKEVKIFLPPPELTIPFLFHLNRYLHVGNSSSGHMHMHIPVIVV